MPVNTLGSQNAVGENTVATRRRTDQVERNRFLQRLDGYRRHHMNSLNQFDNYMNSVYEQQRQDTRLLHQNWIESRAKKVGKSKVARHGQNIANSTAPMAQKLLKQKLNAQNQSPSSSTVNNCFKTSSSSSPLPKTSQESSVETSVPAPVDCLDLQHSVQVSISLGLSNSLQQNHNEITIKLNSSLQNTNSHEAAESGANMEPCKSETPTHVFETIPEPSPVSGTEAIDIGDIDCFSDMFSIDEEFMKSLEFENDYSQESKLPISSEDVFAAEEVAKPKQDVVSCNSDLMLPSAYMDSEFSASFDSTGDVTVATTLQGTTPITPMACLPLEPCTAGVAPPAPPPALLGDTGPAAETLKQMAAHHQNQETVHYVTDANRFAQETFPGRYQLSAACYLDTGFMSQEYGSVMKNSFGSHLDTRMLQQSRTIPGNTQLLQSKSKLSSSSSSSSSAYYHQMQTQHFAEGVVVPSSLQHQMHSHFDSQQEYCTPKPSLMAPASLHDPNIHSGALEKQFRLSQRPQIRNQEHLSMSQCQQLMSMNSDCHAYPVVDGNVTEQGRVHQLYQQPKQQQQQPCYNPYGNGTAYQMHSSVQLHPMYRNVSVNRHGRFAVLTQQQQQQHLDSGICHQITNPLMMEQMRYDAFSAPRTLPPKSNSVYMSNAEMMQHDDTQSSNMMPNASSYCQPRINTGQQQQQHPSAIMKPMQSASVVTVIPAGLYAMGQDLCASSTDWSNLGQLQQQQHLGHQYGGSSDSMSRCRSGGGGNSVLPSYDEHKQCFQQRTIGASHNSLGSSVYGNQDLANCLNHSWTPSEPISSGLPKLHQLHHGMSTMGPKAMHAADNMLLPSHLCLPPSCSGLSSHRMPSVTANGFHGTQCENFEFLGSLDAMASNERELLSQNILDNLPSIY